jgi:hypothetical protein
MVVSGSLHAPAALPRYHFRIIQIYRLWAWLTMYPLPRQSTLYSVIRSGGGWWGVWCGDWRCWMSLWRSEETFWGCTKFWDRPDVSSTITSRCIQQWRPWTLQTDNKWESLFAKEQLQISNKACTIICLCVVVVARRLSNHSACPFIFLTLLLGLSFVICCLQSFHQQVCIP